MLAQDLPLWMAERAAVYLMKRKFIKKLGKLILLWGGPPCQGFSSAGQRLGFREDSRNELYLDFLRFVKEFKPKQFIMENVKE